MPRSLLALLILIGFTPPTLAQVPVPGRSGEEVTYTQHIAAILWERCGECHRPGGAGPFSLLTYEDAKRRAGQIAEVTARRVMPPWKPIAGHGGPFVGDRSLSDTQIDAIARWVDRGAPEGNPSDLPRPQVAPLQEHFGEPDLVVQLARPYTLPADGSDVFRNFVVPVPVSETRCIRALEFRPGNRAVHHANIMIDRTRTSHRFDDQDPDIGYDGPIPSDAEYPDGHFLGWTPGQRPTFLPDDMCWRLEPGSDLLLQVHLRSSGRPEAVQPAIAFFFSQRAAMRRPVMLRLGRQDIDIAAGERLRVSDTFTLPVDAEVHAVQPHAHYRARDVRAFAELPDGSVRWLIHIADWDFNWQDVYRLASPFWLPRGTRLVMEYTYDNSAENPRNPNHPPRAVRWGQQTTDEMGDLWIQVLARSDRDRARLAADARDKALREDIVGYRTMLRHSPADPALHETLAKIYSQVGQLDEALRHVEESVRLKPDSAAGQYNFGTALAAKGRHEEAVRRFTEAVRLDPNLAYAHNSLGVSLFALGRADDAIAHFRHALAIESAYANAHNNLARALEARGALEEAVGHYREAIGIQPDNALTLQNLGGVLARVGRVEEAVALLRRALELSADSASAAARLAWVLATHDVAVGGPGEAMELAERAVTATRRRDAATLDVLAAAYASNGRFEEAISVAESALAAATTARADQLARDIRARLALYRQRRPYREPR